MTSTIRIMDFAENPADETQAMTEEALYFCRYISFYPYPVSQIRWFSMKNEKLEMRSVRKLVVRSRGADVMNGSCQLRLVAYSCRELLIDDFSFQKEVSYDRLI